MIHLSRSTTATAKWPNVNDVNAVDGDILVTAPEKNRAMFVCSWTSSVAICERKATTSNIKFHFKSWKFINFLRQLLTALFNKQTGLHLLPDLISGQWILISLQGLTAWIQFVRAEINLIQSDRPAEVKVTFNLRVARCGRVFSSAVVVAVAPLTSCSERKTWAVTVSSCFLLTPCLLKETWTVGSRETSWRWDISELDHSSGTESESLQE